MKTFRWGWILNENQTDPYISLLEVSGDTVRFWATLKEEQGGNNVICFNKDRKGYSTISERLSLKDAKEAVEKRLFDIGVIEEGDEIVDYTED